MVEVVECEMGMLTVGFDSFMQHPENLTPLTEISNPEERFLAVVKFYLSGWHIKPA